MLCSFNLSAQIIDFPDPNFKAALLDYETVIDTSGDGEIDVSEAQVVSTLILEDSFLAIADMTGIEFFTGLTNLQIRNQWPLTALDLSFLENIIVLRIEANEALTAIDLANLVSCTGDMDIRNNESLLDLDLSSLTNSAAVNISLNSELINLNISNIENVSGLFRINRAKISSVELPNLISVGGSLEFETLLDVISINAPNLLSIGSQFEIVGLPINNTVNFNSLTTVGGRTDIRNTAIVSLAFPNLSEVTAFYLNDNDDLISIDLPVLTQSLPPAPGIDGTIAIGLNPNLQSFNAPLLTIVQDILEFFGNGNLNTLNLNSITEVTGDFVITSSNNGFDFNFPNLTTVGGELRFDGDLSSGGSAAELPQLSSVGDHMTLNAMNFIDISSLTTVNRLDIGSCTIENLDLSAIVAANEMYINSNDLSTIDLSNLQSFNIMVLLDNGLQTVELPALSGVVDELYLGSNPLESVEFGPDFIGFTTAFGITFSGLEFLDLSDIFFTPDAIFYANDSALKQLFLKDGNPLYGLNLDNCDFLEFICTDEDEFDYVNDVLDSYGLSDVVVNSFCSFTPGGEYYTIAGDLLFDLDMDGCDPADFPVINERVTISSSFGDGLVFTDENGHYEFYVVDPASYTIEPDFEFAPLFDVTPLNYTVNVPADIPDIDIPFDANFCLEPIGTVEDVAIRILPLEPARPGFDASYGLFYSNKGNTAVSGQITFNFDDAVLDLLSTSITPLSSTEGELVFAFSDLLPFQSDNIIIKFNVNGPTEDPPVFIDDILSYTANITPDPDENPDNNTFVLDQVVVGSFDPNDKTCLQGATIITEEVGEFVDYLIRFENTGTFPAENVVVVDTIDVSKFDLQSFQVVGASDPLVTRITDNIVEFVFEDINLPFDDANNDGFVLFKIKTLPTLSLGDTFSNSAAIYFDFNFPIITNDAITTIEKPLGLPDFTENSRINLYPVPAEETLKISGLDVSEIEQLRVYNLQGILVLEKEGHDEIEVGLLKKGVYFLQIQTTKGQVFKKFLKK